MEGVKYQVETFRETSRVRTEGRNVSHKDIENNSNVICKDYAFWIQFLGVSLHKVSGTGGDTARPINSIPQSPRPSILITGRAIRL